MDALRRLLALRDRDTRLVAGLNSGTSADGIDVALVEISGAAATTRARLIAYQSVDFEPGVRGRILAAEGANVRELTELHFVTGEAFAAAARAVLAANGLTPAQLDLVASHGQTVCHLPRSAGHAGSTLQIGEGAVLAERLGVPVVCDFRTRDVAAGGEGAPLIPLTDFYLFRAPGRVRALQNIGGIANVTVVADRLEDLVAFDTGPGNMALDEVTRRLTGGAESFDRGGALAARGFIDQALIAELFTTPFFSHAPPRSAGRETFGAAWLAPLLERYRAHLHDLLATLTRFTAEAIRQSYAQFVDPRFPIAELLVSGGGVHNHTLMSHLASLFAPIPVISTASAGHDPDAKEAVAFAVLANETLHGLPGSLPSATGARAPRILGKIVLP